MIVEIRFPWMKAQIDHAFRRNDTPSEFKNGFNKELSPKITSTEIESENTPLKKQRNIELKIVTLYE